MPNKKRVIALGFFDGVHLAHGALLTKTKERARELGATPAVLTFDAHPDVLVKVEKVELINSADGRADIISRYYGIDDVIFVHFDENTMKTPWRTFIDEVVSELGGIHFVVGHDFRFGYKGEGTSDRLAEYCREKGLGYDVIPEMSKGGIRISSTYIRKLIAAGDMERAMEFLGHPHSLVDTVRYGYKLGRTIGSPTINMRFPDGVINPPHGVYAAKVFFDGEEHIAVTNVGTRPTFSGEQKVSVESFILDFEGNLYGKRVRVEFYKFLRLEMKFESMDALKRQIKQDVISSREYFENRKRAV